MNEKGPGLGRLGQPAMATAQAVIQPPTSEAVMDSSGYLLGSYSTHSPRPVQMNCSNDGLHGNELTCKMLELGSKQPLKSRPEICS